MSTLFQTTIPTQFRGLYGTVRAELCPHLGVYDTLPRTRVLLVPASQGLDPENVWDDRDPLPGRGAVLPAILHQLEDPLVFDQRVAESHGVEPSETDDGGVYALSEWNPDEAVDAFVEIRERSTTTADSGSEALDEPTTLYLGRYLPRELDGAYPLDLVIPKKVWCRILLANDRWTIVGRVTSSLTKNPLEHLQVTAHDVDFIQDDRLGQATTDGRGIFRIDYPGAAFRRRPLGGPREGFSGPDLYFEVQDSEGKVVLQESRSQGRRSGRENSGPCACVELQVAVADPRPRSMSGWTGIGIFDLPSGSTPGALPSRSPSFDKDGYAFSASGGERYALHRSVYLRGEVFRKSFADGGFVDLLGNPIRYRFLAMPAPPGAANSTTGQVPETQFRGADIVGVGSGKDLFVRTLVGRLVRPERGSKPKVIVPVPLNRTQLDSEGWVELNAIVADALRASGHAIPLADFSFEFANGLMGLDSKALAKEVGPPQFKTGEPVASKLPIQKFTLRFEVKSFVQGGQGSATSTRSFEMPGHGTQLDAVVMSNDRLAAAVDVREHLDKFKCKPLSGKVELAYTAYHPHLGNVQIAVRSSDRGFQIANFRDVRQDGTVQLPFSNPGDPQKNQVDQKAVELPAADDNGTALKRCTYNITMKVELRLHSGGSKELPHFRLTEFFWSPNPIS